MPDPSNSTGPVEVPPPTPPTPSKFPGAVAKVVGGVPGTLLAIIVAATTLIQQYQSYQESQAVSRAAYDSMKAAIERIDGELSKQARGQRELTEWVQELSSRLERREQARRSRPAVPPPAEPVPAPPAPTPAPTAPTLPEFDELK